MRRAALFLLLAGSLGGCVSAPRPVPPPAAPVAATSAPVTAASHLPDRTKDAPIAAPESATAAPPPAPSTPEPSEPPAGQESEPELTLGAPPDEDAFGIASYYAKRFEGRRTTSGAIYDPSKMTAAHQSLPFGTRVRVVNLRNGREVVVTVTDRCRKRSFPFIDLSRAAAKELGFFGKGITRVQMTVLERESAPASGGR